MKRSRTVMVGNREGVHARAATLVARLVRGFEARVELRKDCERVDAADVLQVLSLGAGAGDQLVAEAWGREAEAVLEALGRLFEHRFDDEIARQLGLQGGNRQDVESDGPPGG